MRLCVRCPRGPRVRFAAYAENLTTRGALDWKDWIRKADEVRALAARLIGADSPSSIAIVPNTSYGLNIVASGFPFAAGDSS